MLHWQWCNYMLSTPPKQDVNVRNSGSTRLESLKFWCWCCHWSEDIIFQTCWCQKCWNSKLKTDVSFVIFAWSFTYEKWTFSLENSFVFFWFVTCLLVCISKNVLATYSRFCGAGSHIVTTGRTSVVTFYGMSFH